MDVELEGERALHHMETAAPAAVLDQLLLVAAAAAPALLAACPAAAFPPAASRLARCTPLTQLQTNICARHTTHAPFELTVPPDTFVCAFSLKGPSCTLGNYGGCLNSRKGCTMTRHSCSGWRLMTRSYVATARVLLRYADTLRGAVAEQQLAAAEAGGGPQSGKRGGHSSAEAALLDVAALQHVAEELAVVEQIVIAGALNFGC